MPDKLEIFYHLGLGKVASTYLQHRFFPKLKGIEYISTRLYRTYPEILKKRGSGRFILSRENDRQLESEVKKFAEHFTDVKPILIFRRHDSWLASQYRRFVKNGLSIPFEEFIDIDEDKGYWQKKELDFFHKIEIVEKYFDHKPLVLFHDEIKSNPIQFFDKICAFIGATYNPEEVDLSPFHKSYNEKQLLFMRSIGKYVLPMGRSYHSNRLIATLQRYWRMMIKYPILYFASLLPNSYVNNKVLIDPDQLARIRSMWEDDWVKLEEYAKKNNPSQ